MNNVETIPAHVRHDAPAAPPASHYQEQRLERLRQAVSLSSITAIATRIGVSRSALSLVLSGQYQASPERILNRFDAMLDGVQCPHLRLTLARERCVEYATKPRPSAPLGLQHWRACQRCPRRPS